MSLHSTAAAEEVVAHAPGRVNLMGEHTDYNGGFVLPMAIPQRTRAALTPRADREVVVSSRELHDTDAYRLGDEARRGDWLDYLMGVTSVLRAEGLEVGGFDLRLSSDVPVGSGLSSSAALEVAVLRALRTAFCLPLDDVRLAVLAQRVETEFVGAPVGIMDQMACSLADEGAALFLDTRTLRAQRVAIPPGIEPVVINSGVQHSHAGGDYRLRRAECEDAARRLGVPQLRDLPEDPDLSALPPLLKRRVRHVLTENARVLATVAALLSADREALTELLAASHASQRDDYEVSVAPIDVLVELSKLESDVIGGRLTGGGFGGSVVLLADAGTGRAAGERIANTYRARTGLSPAVLVPPGGRDET